MIRPKKINAVGIVVRDLKRSLRWYREKFGFRKLFAVCNGVIIGANGVELWLAQAKRPAKARKPNTDRDICIRLFGFEISKRDLARVKAEFPEDRDIIEIDHSKYRSNIVEDPDGHAIELYVNK